MVVTAGMVLPVPLNVLAVVYNLFGYVFYWKVLHPTPIPLPLSPTPTSSSYVLRIISSYTHTSFFFLCTRYPILQRTPYARLLVEHT